MSQPAPSGDEPLRMSVETFRARRKAGEAIVGRTALQRRARGFVERYRATPGLIG